MAVDVKIPNVGESVQEGMIEAWQVEDGAQVNQDDILLSLETDKATVDIVAEVSGKIEILTKAGQVVKIGDVVARIDEKSSAQTKKKHKAKNNKQPSQESIKEPGPAVRRMAQESGVDPSMIKGSGKDGRVTKQDMLAKQSSTKPGENIPKKIIQTPTGERAVVREPMSMMRRRIAERLIDAQKNSAILTTFNEVNMSAILKQREKYGPEFLKKNGVKLGFMGFFLKAAADALLAYPRVNAYLEENDLIYHHYCDIGVAVSTDKGLVVPIIKNVEQMTLAEIEQAIAAYAQKARENKITIEDLNGGTFTVSNGGIFGSLLSTPIINPPQTAILGMHKIQMRPIVMDSGKIEAQPMMYLALSYDHRIIDGKEAVGFLVHIKDCLEDLSRITIGV